jgi:hypothetical protein
MSKHNDLLIALAARLATITESGGFSCNAGDNIFRGLEYETSPPVLPCLAYFVGETVDGAGSTPPSQGEENHLLPIEINGYVADTVLGAAADNLRQDILRALRSDEYLGGLSEGFEGTITSASTSEPRILDEDDPEHRTGDDQYLGMCKVNVTIFYVTLYGES